ncbi:MAG: DUF2934 domain-containing protein [Chthoniobacterales bacterium]|nr:DUF2934 domain-containing protein [Chthoniobacterales bacterium]
MDKKTSIKPTPVKATSSSSKASSKAAPKKVAPSQEEIALRAYFISERRQQLGWEGDPVSDWTDAEQQLIAESK